MKSFFSAILQAVAHYCIQKERTALKKQAKRNSGQKLPAKEEISLELEELGHLQPKQQPMTPNHREKAEKDKDYS